MRARAERERELPPARASAARRIPRSLFSRSFLFSLSLSLYTRIYTFVARAERVYRFFFCEWVCRCVGEAGGEILPLLFISLLIFRFALCERATSCALWRTCAARRCTHWLFFLYFLFVRVHDVCDDDY